VGYCQGMSYVAGLVLMYTTDFEAFLILEQLMNNKKYNLNGLYIPHFPQMHFLSYEFEVLLGEFFPIISQKLDGIDPLLYLMPSYLSIFAQNCPWDLVVRIWDMFALEGDVVLHKAVLAIFYAYREKIMEFMDLVDIMDLMRNISPKYASEIILKMKNIKITNEQRKSIRESYENSNKQPADDILEIRPTQRNAKYSR